MNSGKLLICLLTLGIFLIFSNCSKPNSGEEEPPPDPSPRTFVRIEVDNHVYEYFDANVKAEHWFTPIATTVGSLYDTAAADLQGKPGFFISYSGNTGTQVGDFWVTWGTWNKFSYQPSSTPDGWTTGNALSSDPNKRRYTVTKVSSDKKSWSGDFYHEVGNSLGELKIIKGTFSIVGQ